MNAKNNSQTKKCKGCSVEKPIDCFYKKPSGKYGVEAYCHKCRQKIKGQNYVENREQILERRKEYRIENIEKFKLKDKKYQEKNKDKIAIRRKAYYNKNLGEILEKKSVYYLKNKDIINAKKNEYYQKNKGLVLLRCKKYYENNKDKISQKGKKYYILNSEKVKEKNIANKDELRRRRRLYYIKNADRLKAIGIANYRKTPERFKMQKMANASINRKKERERYRNDPFFRLNQLMRAGIYGALGANKKGRRWESLVDFDLEILKKHLTKLMKKYNKSHVDEKDMTWENYGEWQIDHKIPKAVFNYTRPEHDDFKRCWALKNLQPLWKIDNLIKRAKIEKPFQPSLAFDRK